MAVSWKLFSSQGFLCWVCLHVSGKWCLALVDGKIVGDLNLCLYTFIKFLRTAQLVCVIFLKKEQPYIYFLKDENIRNHVCFGTHCKCAFWLVSFLKSSLIKSIEITHRSGGNFWKKPEDEAWLSETCLHTYVHMYMCSHIHIPIFFFLEGPVPDAMLRTFSTALTHLNGIGDSTSSTTIIVIIIVIIYWYSERLNDSPKFTRLANGRAKGLNSDPPDSLTAYCLQWCVQVFYVLNLKDL